jgi:TRAP-type uncharacterized transport system substrate-binding protein
MKKLLLMTAAVVMSCSANAADKPHFRLCTGNPNLNYYKAGHMLKTKSDSVMVDVIETKGSLDNLDKMISGECDGAYVQNDALLVYSQKNAQAISTMERAGILYSEQAHMLCNKSAELGRMVNLTKDMTVAIGPEGSGAHTTWDAFVMADKKRYGVVNTDSRSGQRALNAVADGSGVTCALVVTALNSSFMKNDAQQFGDKIVLVGTDDRDMANTAKDSKGRNIYSYGEVPSGTYPKVQPSALFGTKAIGTIQVDAVFVASQKWIGDHDQDYDKLLRAFSAARPEIAKLAQPQ